MKKKVGLLAALLAVLTAANSFTPILSGTIKDIFTTSPQTGSIDRSADDTSTDDYTLADKKKSAGTASEKKETAYDGGKILIYDFDQLSMIGSGKSYTYDDGVSATYSLDADYKIARDISVPRHTVWQLPEGFKGTITGEKQESAPLYDGQSDEIFIYNPYQLAVTAMDDRDTQPVMSGDSDSATFGTGKVICTDEEGKSYLTYDDDRNYVVSAQFNSEVSKKSPSVINTKSVESVAAAADGPVAAKAGSSVGTTSDGRDFAGQVIKKINGETYILIGNADQLRAIGTDAEVFTAVYQTDYTTANGHVIDTQNGVPIQLYGGDADLESDQNGYRHYDFQQINDLVKPYLTAVRYFVGVNQETGQPYTDATHATTNKNSLTEASWRTGEKYTTKANYIIFRNIDLEGSANSNQWTPLMFSGKMYGAKSANGEALWNGSTITDSTQITATAEANRPLISNVYINQTTAINANNYVGVGFFATISNQPNETDIGLSGGTATVKNIDLRNVHVENNTNQQEKSITSSVINTVTTGLGTALDTVLGALLTLLSAGSLPVDTLNHTLSSLLNARPDDPTVFATGAFAGRVSGDVLIEDCRVSGTVEVSNINDRTGGFVGYTEGVTEYDGLSDTLSGVSSLLAGVLNVIPVLGLGDVITILLDNGLDIGDLIPTGYIAPEIKSCEANGLSGYFGTSTKDFAGGFVGEQIGTKITGCSVTESEYTVRAKNYGGGFCGLARDAVIMGTLDGVGINLSQATLQNVEDIHTQSVLKDCSISGWDQFYEQDVTPYNVTGENMLGGFVGAMTSSYAIDCTIDCGDKPIEIYGSGDDVGGFVGYATVGWQSSLGKDDSTTNSKSLLGTVGKLVSKLTSSNPSEGQLLLSLMGISPSAVIGCQVYSSELTVKADGSYAGGLVGRGDALYLGRSNQAAYTELAKWNSGTLDESPDNKPVVLSGLKSVTAQESYAGGIAGYMGSAAFQGLLNNVVGLGDFIGFNASDISVTGVTEGYTVTAGSYNAGGGFGFAVGGDITNVNLDKLKRVQAYNRAAGFVGCAGPGELAGSNGLTLNLLGLNNVLEVSNLLSVGQGIEVQITDCNVTGVYDVSGVPDGFEVEATGSNQAGEAFEFTAAGFIADSNSTQVVNSHVDKLKSVTAANTSGFAGGFIGTSETGGLAEIAENDNTGIGGSNSVITDDGYYLIKPDWTINDLAGKFTENSSNQGEYMLTTRLAEGDKIKVVKVENNAITAWYPDGYGTEYTVDSAHAGKVNIYFKDTYQNAWSSFGGYFYIEVASVDENGLHGLDDFVSVDVNEGTALLDVNGLLDAIGYLIPSYTNCTTTFVDEGWVDADVAGGFVADLESGTVDNSGIGSVDATYADAVSGGTDSKWTKIMKELYDPDNPAKSTETGDLRKQFAVFNIDDVYGRTFGGGFAGRLRSGALADSGKGVSILGNLSVKILGQDVNVNIGIDDLVSVIQAYVPYVKNAGVYSENGFTVEANTVRSGNAPGAAGGFAGLMSGAQVSHSDVYQLKNTEVTPPSDLEAVSAASYFDSQQNTYAVTGGSFAGGYVGKMDIGDAASVGSGLNVLGDALNLSNLVSALNVVVSTIEHSDVQGAPGGFSAIADGTLNNGKVGMAGGYAGSIYGGHIQNSHCKNFYYMIGQEASGGYVGNMEPGDVASLLGRDSNDGTHILDLVQTSAALASLVEDFVPTIRNSTTSCVPCGGAVRAQASSDSGHQRGCAGGYCGHNEGGHIWGLNTSTWKDQNDGQVGNNNYGHNTEGNYVGEQHICTAWRIRSVYGYEYAGGFTGFMESADTANTGNVSLLGKLINASNLVNALSMVYPTEETTAVYGPLRNIDNDTWNAWVNYVGKYGGYGLELARGGVSSPQAKYYYGCNVAAGRSTVFDNGLAPITEGGNAGGYVGYMVTGVITNGQSYDMKNISAMRSAGGYAGRMQGGSAADFGSADIAGMITANLGDLVNALDVFVPVIKSGTVRGWQSGMTVTATGVDSNNSNNDLTYRCGYAGGYVGSAYGAQIWGDENVGNTAGTGCNVTNLRFVKGSNAAGGYVGLATAASVADVGTGSVGEQGSVLQSLLDTLITTNTDNLVSVLQATITTIRDANVNPDTNSFGFAVEGSGDNPPRLAGGFAGSLEAAVINKRDGGTSVTVNGLRSVDGLYYAGGFVGLADVTSVASVSDTGDNSTTILSLIEAGKVDVLDIFRTYIYDSDVNGVSEGYIVRAHSSSAPEGLLSEVRCTGCAGGFAGGMMNGTIKRSDVTSLNAVSGINYNGGFIGHAGKNGAVDVDNATVSSLAGATAGVLDIFGTVIDDCDVTGIAQGVIVSSAGYDSQDSQPIAGGYAGYADVSQIKNSDLTNLKLVNSAGTAGGFVGKTNMNYLISVEASSPLVQLVLGIVNELVKLLYVVDLENLGLINLDSQFLGLKLLSDGDLLYVNLLGLKIGVSLAKSAEPGVTDTALITIGDSSIELPCSEDGIDMNNQNAEVVVNLIKGNRTRVDNCSLKGIDDGYDVYGGGASDSADGTTSDGYAGGFVGYNNEGKFTSNVMEYCDIVRGTEGKVGPFSGETSLLSVYSFNNLASIEMVENEENTYYVYRQTDMTYALTESNQVISSNPTTDNGYKRFEVTHLAEPIAPGANESDYQLIFGKWEDAVLASSSSGADSAPIDVYQNSGAKAVLMLDTPINMNDESLIPVPGVALDPCDEKTKLTVQKVWDDENNKDGVRPELIKVRLWQHWYDESGDVVYDGNAEKVTLYTDSSVISDIDTTNGWFAVSRSDHGRADSAAWTRVIDGLPVYSEAEHSYFTYTVEESPIVGYDSEVTYDTTGTTQTAKIVNTRKDSFEIEFKYYDRYEINGEPAGIDSEETVYSVSVKAVPSEFITYSQPGVVQSVNFSNLIGAKAVEFEKNALAVSNVMCDYDLWTSQSAAVSAMGSRNYFVNGEEVDYGDETVYHTDYLGIPQNSGEKWVNYYDSEENELEESFSDASDYLNVNKIVVWCYNYPKQYNVNIYGADSSDDLVQKTVCDNTVYVANAESSDNGVKRLNDKFYYNQRFGGVTGKTEQDAAGFIENYGLLGYTNVMPSDYAAESFGDYTFAYWAYDQNGAQIASVERDFWYRVSVDTKLYAVYSLSGSSNPGISISANANDTYVDSSGVSRTRLNILGNVFGAPAYDQSVEKLSFVNISLSTQIRNHPEVYTPEKINALFEQYKPQLKELIKTNDEENGSKPFTSNETYNGDIDTTTGKVNSALNLTLTTKGYIYTVTSNGNSPAPGDSTTTLTNKNRMQYTISYKTSALNLNNTGTSGNTCLMYCGALRYAGEWSVSTNCLIYYNGKVVANTASTWE